MAQRIFQSFRRLPGHFTAFNRKTEVGEAQGNAYKAKICSDYGFPAKPVSISYDPILDFLSLLTRDGNLAVYGKPGVVFTATHNDPAEFIQVLFLNGTRRLITLTESDDVYLWELTVTAQSSVRFVQTSCLKNITQKLRSNFVNGVTNVENTDPNEGTNHVTAICVATDGTGFLLGTENGWVASVRLNIPSKLVSKNFDYLTLPTPDEAITPSRILNGLSPNRQHRLRLDAVVVLSERPGFPGQLLIGYSSGLSLIYDLRADRVVVLLPWKHGLEAAAWCGGNGLPHRSSSTATPIHLGMRLLTAHSDGSLGVWSLHDAGFSCVTSSPAAEPPVLNMEDPPTRPYGPFPCKLISKVFWLSSPLGGITAFVGGMPRATYGERHTVSLLRGSNLDRAAAANVVAARIAAAAQAEDDDEDDDDDDLMPNSGRRPNTPMHVFDPDAPEHVCLDLPSRLVDLLPIGPVGGPAQMLLLLCEEELVAVDLMTPGWPFIRPPYLTCLHTAAITAYSLVTQVNTKILTALEAAGAHYGPEGRFGRGSAIMHNQNAAGWSGRSWPIRGGLALVNGARLSTSLIDDSALFTDDLLLTGHEDGSVAFWRLSACGCMRRIYTLHTAVLFEGDFGLPGHGNEMEDEIDAWPPFRQAGVFDPFMDDSRAAVQMIRLIDHTVAVGGAAGQVTLWQFLDHTPIIKPVTVAIKTDLPGFQWKGYAPLRVSFCMLRSPFLCSPDPLRR
ncbi:putative inorganic pyrophosphatase [Fasciola hepatica]|uniref:Inorganic pyrophosphatase n=1 Tax=Fasciola hepatica TaxID=6192 RepID=A0A4E0R3M7_FASHE|nr:putative inorganic pyrophosphatase [Fasciola hepatica]